jgi:hypothetical protein
MNLGLPRMFGAFNEGGAKDPLGTKRQSAFHARHMNRNVCNDFLNFILNFALATSAGLRYSRLL